MADMDHKQEEQRQAPKGASGAGCPWCGSKKGLYQVHPERPNEPFVCKDCNMPPKPGGKTVNDDIEENEIPVQDPDRLDEYPEDDGEFAGYF